MIDGLTANWTQSGFQYGTTGRPIKDPPDDDCVYKESFGQTDPLQSQGSNPDGWTLWTINHLPDKDEFANGEPRYEMRLANDKASIDIRAHRWTRHAAQVQVLLFHDQGRQAIQVDDETIPLNFEHGKQARAAYVLARLCAARQVKNVATGVSVGLSGVCPMISLMLARTYYCSGF